MEDYELALEALAEVNPEAITFDGFDEAVIGMCDRFGQETVALYDYNKMVQILEDQGMDDEEAVEFLEFNVVGMYAGPSTPAFAHFPL